MKSIKYKKITYTKHSRAKMKDLSLTAIDIEAILKNGHVRENIKGKLEIYFGKKGKALVAIFKDYPDELILITIWRE